MDTKIRRYEVLSTNHGYTAKDQRTLDIQDSRNLLHGKYRHKRETAQHKHETREYTSVRDTCKTHASLNTQKGVDEKWRKNQTLSNANTVRYITQQQEHYAPRALHSLSSLAFVWRSAPVMDRPPSLLNLRTHPERSYAHPLARPILRLHRPLGIYSLLPSAVLHTQIVHPVRAHRSPSPRRPRGFVCPRQ